MPPAWRHPALAPGNPGGGVLRHFESVRIDVAVQNACKGWLLRNAIAPCAFPVLRKYRSL